MARCWRKPAPFGTVGRTRHAWVASHAGTPSWTKTTIWSASGTSSSPPEPPAHARRGVVLADRAAGERVRGVLPAAAGHHGHRQLLAVHRILDDPGDGRRQLRVDLRRVPYRAAGPL